MNKNILWLASWYPNILSPMEGDFLQRHAKAVSMIHSITVIFIKKDEKGTITKNYKKEIATSGNLTEIIIYYHPVKTGIKMIDRLLSRKKYNSIYREILKKFIQENGKPGLVHVQVAINVIWQALFLKKKYSIPFIVSDQWTGYLPEAKPNLENYHPLYKRWLKKMFHEASAVSVVSDVLGKAISGRFGIKKYTVIQNVVDTNIFYPIQKQDSPVTKFIHVSLLNYQKDPEEIIEAFYRVKNSGYNFQLAIYGPDNLQLKELVKNKHLTNEIIFKTEVPQEILAKDMQQSDALILYSRYETFGCVVIEANACGIPSILSDLPVFREYIIENETGVFATPGDPGSLADTIIQFIKHKSTFAPTEIAAHTKNKFSYEIIARQFDELYKSVGTRV